MRFLIGYGLFLLVLAWASFAHARVIDKAAGSFFWNGHRAFLSHHVLGATCSSMRSLRSEIPCNPALLTSQDPEESISYLEDSVFAANLFFGDDYDVIYKNRNLFREDDKLALAESLLGESKPVRFEAAVNLWWRAPYLAILYQPARVTYYSQVRNPSYPDIAIHAMEESEIAVSWGGQQASHDENLYLGVNFRYVERKFIHEEFNLFDAAPNMDEYLVAKKQKLFLIEPGVSYRLTGDSWLHTWRPQVSANLSQLGYADEKYEEVPQKPVLDSGISFSPPVRFGEFEFALNYRWTSEIANERKLRLGIQYQIGMANFMAGYDESQWALGVSSFYRNLSAGIMYKRVETESFEDAKIYDDSAYVEFRLML